VKEHVMPSPQYLSRVSNFHSMVWLKAFHNVVSLPSIYNTQLLVKGRSTCGPCHAVTLLVS